MRCRQGAGQRCVRHCDEGRSEIIVPRGEGHDGGCEDGPGDSQARLHDGPETGTEDPRLPRETRQRRQPARCLHREHFVRYALLPLSSRLSHFFHDDFTQDVIQLRFIPTGELLVIVEYCRFGNLHDYLRSRRDDFLDDTDDSALRMDTVAVASGR